MHPQLFNSDIKNVTFKYLEVISVLKINLRRTQVFRGKLVAGLWLYGAKHLYFCVEKQK